MKSSKFMSYTNSYYKTKDDMNTGEIEWQGTFEYGYLNSVRGRFCVRDARGLGTKSPVSPSELCTNCVLLI